MSTELESVLVVEDDDAVREATVQALELAGFAPRAFASAEHAKRELRADLAGCVVTDIRMEGMDGLELMRLAHEIDADIPVILVTGHGDVAMAVSALKNGAFDFLAKPFSSELLAAAVRRALSARALVLDNRRLRHAAEQAGSDDLLGTSDAMAKLRTTVGQIAMIDLDVLIEGETGVGKELVARKLHQSSARAFMPFTALRCSSLSEAAAAELFGAGAVEFDKGVLGQSAGGILFLNEIEALPGPLQARLLAYLETRERQPGDQRTGVRIVAATRHNLEEEARAGRFREDLFYRLGVLRLRIPPLRERREDVPVLFAQFVREALDRTRRKRFDLSAADRRKLLLHDWPGNARELRSYAYSAVLNLSRAALPVEPSAPDLAARVAGFERTTIADALSQAGGSISGACRALKVSRQTMYEKISKHGLRLADFR